MQGLRKEFVKRTNKSCFKRKKNEEKIKVDNSSYFTEAVTTNSKACFWSKKTLSSGCIITWQNFGRFTDNFSKNNSILTVLSLSSDQRLVLNPGVAGIPCFSCLYEALLVIYQC